MVTDSFIDQFLLIHGCDVVRSMWDPYRVVFDTKRFVACGIDLPLKYKEILRNTKNDHEVQFAVLNIRRFQLFICMGAQRGVQWARGLGEGGERVEARTG